MAYVVERKPLSLSERLYLPQILAGMKITLRHMFQPKVTMEYPEQRPPIPPGYRGVPTLVKDPQREISLIYYPNRQGLEDRVFRIKTERSSATMPDTRTSHNISNVELEGQQGDIVTVRFNWHTLSFRYKTIYQYFGMSRYRIDVSGAQPKIVDKYVVLKNDYINQVIDIFHI